MGPGLGLRVMLRAESRSGVKNAWIEGSACIAHTRVKPFDA